ncbi:MAG: PAS domain S-box protein [Planctomycetes bacterium]|nr:PAS domain S-box protein [Planctomycetota bacterium]
MWNQFKRFWNAEEVPRWFGLSVVLIYLVGLAGVGYVGVLQTRRQADTEFRALATYGVKLLSQRLQEAADGDGNGATRSVAFQRALRDFSANVAVRSLRVVDSERRVIASIRAGEIDSYVADDANGAKMSGSFDVSEIHDDDGAEPDLFVRASLGSGVVEMRGASARDATSTSNVGDGTTTGGSKPSSESSAVGRPALFLEAIIPSAPPRRDRFGDYSPLLSVVLVVCGALFVTYRALRSHMRGASRIAARLVAHAESLEGDLTSLQLADSMDQATVTWNRLIAMARDMRGELQRAQANDEVSGLLASTCDRGLADAINAVPDAIVHVVNGGRVEFANTAARRLLGWEGDEGADESVIEGLGEGLPGAIADVAKRALRADGGFDACTELIETEQGDSNSYRMSVIPLRGAEHFGECLVVIRDVSQQIRADRAREDFITQVTHELRTPLTNIRAYADTLSSGMFDDPKVITECYNVITKETRRLSRLIEDILSVSQMEVGSIELTWDDVDLTSLLGEGIRDVRGLADEKNIDLQVVLPAKVSPIRGDRDKLAVVVNNLLGNAIKYTPADGAIVVACRFSEDAVTLTVKDNGIGIAPKDHARIFEKFQRADDEDVSAIPGTGIGLYTAREIARCHGGEIDLFSEKGKGSTFIVKLPLQASRATSLTTRVGE